MFNSQSDVQACFTLLDEHEKGISKSIARYILSGDDTAILTRLGQFSREQLQAAAVSPPRSPYRNYQLSEERQKKAAKIYENFENLYRSDLLADIEIARRMGVAMAACADMNNIQRHYQAEVPDWLAVLIAELNLLRTFGGNRNELPKHYDQRWFLSLVRQNDLRVTLWLPVLLERRENHWYCNFVRQLAERFDWPALLQDPEITAGMAAMHFSGRGVLAECLLPQQNLDAVLAVVVALLGDNSKQVRQAAMLLIPKLSSEKLLAYLDDHYLAFDNTARKTLVPMLPVLAGDGAVELLEKWQSAEPSKAIRETIGQALANKAAARHTAQAELVLPEWVPLATDASIPNHWLEKLTAQYAKSLTAYERAAEEERTRNLAQKTKYDWQQKTYKRWLDYKPEQIRRDLDALLGSSTQPGLAQRIQQGLEQLTGKQTDRDFTRLKELCLKANLLSDADFTAIHLVRFFQGDVQMARARPWFTAHPGVVTDLRQLAQLIHQQGGDVRKLAQWLLIHNWNTDAGLPDTYGITIWPFFAENGDYLKEAFGLMESREKNYYKFELAHGMAVIAQFPVIPETYLQVLYQQALSTGKTYGPLAREILGKYGIAPQRILDALGSGKVDERIVAADWIAELKLKQAVPELQKALKKETHPAATAILLAALHDLDSDISAYLAPAVLLKEAQNNLKKALPKGLAWFPFDALPALKWLSGEAIDRDVLQWWLALACKLKQPEGNPLLDLYVRQLEGNSRKSLGNFILHAFIHEDTLNPDDETAHAFAKQYHQQHFDNWQKWAKSDWGKQYADKTLDDAYRELFNQKKAEYLGSAIGEKGILALAAYAEPAEAVLVVKRYMKDHYTRRAQIEALLTALANNNDPTVIQLLLAVARRHRTKSVQETARELVAAIADRNGWSHDELADRTIPTAGFESNGTQRLSYGSRSLVLKLNNDLTVILENEAGKVLKTLPTPRQDDDAEAVKQAKTDFSNSKKELKQVQEMQTQRLYEAMCVGRVWQGAEWRTYLLEHPLMQRLLQRMVWQVETNGESRRLRPTAELELIDLDDETYDLADDARISVAHAGQLPQEEAKAWAKHFKDEKLKPLFEQINLPQHELTDAELAGKQLDYHQGWMTDTFTLRGVLTKRGYQRATAEDGGFFTHYYKDFASLNLRVMIEFSGNCLPEENVAAVLYQLAFISPDQRGWVGEESFKPLHGIPRSLLFEAMLDYEAVAAKGSFDADWRQKSPW
ncbi:DUF4132 domain-containing protein [Methylomonas sp. EFPC1]|uniref:DUF4132 domain-containing protein n=1 Tax=Methylomonas sp. EFPC1 TaxID=2812647 RepID=UPI001967ADC3|nr:DUF4132 domain-containing protein [Methylomonas sp. EFPC1]QSA99814.1 DUF4132 domain-containing protein [Methylomonas sp. EFPC1]